MSQSTDDAVNNVPGTAPANGNWNDWAANLTNSERAALRQVLTVDQETGLLNRDLFMDTLRKELQRGRRYKRILSLAVIRIDNYETVLADKGSTEANALMKHAADLVKARIRDVDVAGRFSPNEVAVLMPETDGMAGSMVASRIGNHITATVLEINSDKIAVPVSVGVAAFPRDGKDWADLVFWARTDLEPHPC